MYNFLRFMCRLGSGGVVGRLGFRVGVSASYRYITQGLGLGMLTRLETRKNFSVSSIEFLAVEKCDKQLD